MTRSHGLPVGPRVITARLTRNDSIKTTVSSYFGMFGCRRFGVFLPRCPRQDAAAEVQKQH